MSETISATGRRVPDHGSGGGSVNRARDPDETAGRALYRATADAEARASMVPSRKARLTSTSAVGRALSTGDA